MDLVFWAHLVDVVSGGEISKSQVAWELFVAGLVLYFVVSRLVRLDFFMRFWKCKVLILVILACILFVL